MSALAEIWKKLSQIGVKPYANSGIQFELTSINQLAFLSFLVTVIGMIGNLAAAGMNNMILLLFIYGFIYLSVPFLNLTGNHLAAKLTFLYNFQLFHFILAVQFGPQSQAQVIYLVAIVFVFLFFSENKPITRFLILVTTILLPVLIFSVEYNIVAIDLGFQLTTPDYLDVTVYFTSIIYSVLILFMTFRGLRKIFVNQSRNNIDLINSNAALKAKVQERVDLFAQVIHDLKSPIQSLVGLSTLMKEEDDPEQRKVILGKRDETLLKLKKNTDEELERFKDEKFELNPEPLDVRKEIKEILDLVRFYHGYRKVKFIVDVDQDVPLYTDKKYLQVIIGNLVSNAIKYANLKKNPFLKISSSIDDKMARMEFEDNGHGIEKEKLPMIFNRLYRATEYGEGSGIGMSLVKKAVETLDGQIEVESQVGEGTKISLSIANMQAEE